MSQTDEKMHEMEDGELEEEGLPPSPSPPSRYPQITRAGLQCLHHAWAPPPQVARVAQISELLSRQLHAMLSD